MEKSSGARMKANTDIYLPRLSWTCPRQGGSIALPNCRRISPWATSHRKRKTNPGSRTPRTRIKRRWPPRRKCRRHRCFLERRPSRFLTQSEATSFNCPRSRQKYFWSSPWRRTSREHAWWGTSTAYVYAALAGSTCSFPDAQTPLDSSRILCTRKAVPWFLGHEGTGCQAAH